MSRPGGERDQSDALRGEHAAQPRRDHSALPRPPVHGYDATPRPPPSFALGEFVERLIRGGVSHLTRTAESSGGRREEREQFERVVLRRRKQGAEAADL